MCETPTRHDHSSRRHSETCEWAARATNGLGLRAVPTAGRPLGNWPRAGPPPALPPRAHMPIPHFKTFRYLSLDRAPRRGASSLMRAGR
ncbi:hypothetical protein EVAR_48183_1 [Eumeta japonica]|uniref:Uncharacterized protein n=1 Tax=Eumeta variegata TaxID=151549 RepID=A0A4C1XS47_EUMVA|nr:hypothetical protein EVAR_48183_1 [Eumeta japonica]